MLQGVELQAWSCEDSPGHAPPRFACSETGLMRNWLPPLQDLEQADQASHSPHVQLTKDIYVIYVFYIKIN